MEQALMWDMIMRDQHEYGIHLEWDRVVDLLELAILEPVEEDEDNDTGYEGDVSSDDLDISLTTPEHEKFKESDPVRVGPGGLEVMDFGFFAGVTLEEMDELQKMDSD
jgi:hypothetical protein